MKKTNIDAWLKSGEYLPEPLRDFHDQKDVFRAMHDIVAEPGPDEIIKRPSWVEGQCYVIDMFLWFMARRGYTLQRTRRKGDFRDLGADVRQATASRDQAMSNIFKQALAKPEGDDTVSGKTE